MDAAIAVIQASGLKPRRTLRVVLWTNEENGLRGGKAYRDAHRAELKDIVAALESDAGSERITSLGLDLRKATPEAKAAALASLKELGRVLAPFGPIDLRLGGSGADVSPMVAEGVPGIGIGHAATHYFDVHHTHADTFDKVDPADLAHNAAVLATFAFALAQSTVRFR